MPSLPETSRAGRPVAAAIFVSCLATMMLETTLVRLLSVVMFFHVAYFVLAIALFGIGIGGLYAFLLQQNDPGGERTWRLLGHLPAAFGISTVCAVVAPVLSPLRIAEVTQLLPTAWVFGTFLISALPFMFGSMYLSILFARHTAQANRLYFIDLVGAALGCLLAVPLLGWLGGFAAPLAVAILGTLPAFAGPGAVCWTRRAAGWAAVLAAGTVLALQARYDILAVEEGALFSKWNFYSNITFVRDAEFRGWRASPACEAPIPRHLRLMQDGRAPAYVVEFDGDFKKVRYLKCDVTSLPYRIVRPQKALVIGAGGGRDLLTAKMYGVPEVTGVELNPVTVAAMRNEFREFSGGVYDLPGVDVVTDNGRTFAERDRSVYDLVFLSLADTTAASSQGAFVLSENHLYTVEAFKTYWNRLNDGGALAIVSNAGWSDFMLRLVSTARQTLLESGIERPEQHILTIMTHPNWQDLRAVCLIVSRTPIDRQYVARALASSEELGFSLVWPPLDYHDELSVDLERFFDAEKRDEYIAESALDLSPLRDDRPYFYYMLRPEGFFRMLINPDVMSTPPRSLRARLSSYLRLFIDPESPTTVAVRKHMRALHTIVGIFAAAFVCVFALMVAPLLLFQRDALRGGPGAAPARFLMLFFLLGLSYMLVEIALLQKLFVLLGNPIRTFSVTLGAMLFFTGLGSLFAQRAQGAGIRAFVLIAAFAAIDVQLAAYLLAPALIDALHAAPAAVRIAGVAVFVACIATPMGMLMPTTMRWVHAAGLPMISWAWGMNGVGSVLGSVGATLFALNFGIQNTFLLGVAGYALFGLIALTLPAPPAQVATAESSAAAGA